MIRVIYEWRVPSAQMAAFKRLWAETTEQIHQSVEGTLGSVMLQSDDCPDHVMTVARWRTKKDWERFFQAGNPKEMAAMNALAERVNVKVFAEVEDRTRD